VYVKGLRKIFSMIAYAIRPIKSEGGLKILKNIRAQIKKSRKEFSNETSRNFLNICTLH